MKTGKKQQPLWLSLGKGLLLALGVYLAGHLMLAALMVRGSVGEGGALWVTGGLCLLSALLGGAYAARRTPWGAVRSGLLGGVLLAVSMALVGMVCWGGLNWTGQSGALTLCALGGGLAGGMCARKRKPRRRMRL